MKKVLIVLFSLFVIILIALVTIPIIFKDDIKKAIDDAVAENVNADVYFDAGNFGLSFFSHFPSLTVKMEDFGVVNHAPFKGDTLVSVQKFELAVNVMSLFGDQIQLNGIYLIDPNINVKVLKNGKANYDIAKATEEEAPLEEDTSEEAAEFSIGINKWLIQNANIRYTDLSSDLKAVIEGLTHEGSGDFTQTVFDLNTNTHIDAIDLVLEGDHYLRRNSFDAKLILNMNMDNNTYTFKENEIALNKFVFGFDGSIVLGDEIQDYDLTFSAKETTFKNVLSLVPAVFKKDFESLETSGTLAFDGFVKGKMEGENLPDFAVNLVVNEGMFHYPDLPSSVENVTIDLHVKKEGESLEATEVNLNKFHLDLGQNPVDITAKTKGIESIEMLVDAAIHLNLEEVAGFYPIDGLDIKGNIDLDAKVNGTYNENSLPDVTAELKLENGYVKSSEVPAPITDLTVHASAKSQGGDMVNSMLEVETFKMSFDGNPFEAYLHVENFEDYTYNTKVTGQVDIGNIMKIFPQEGIDLEGIIAANLETSGKMSDIEAERYDKLPTSGNMDINNFAFKSEDLPQGLTIKSARFKFNPKEAALKSYSGTLGNSDMQMSGSVENYLGYVLNNQTLKGKLNYSSNTFDLNEWMTEEEEVVEEESGEEEDLVVEPIPRNIDFVLNASINKILYDPEINNLKGEIIIRDGAVSMNRVGFNMLNGSFVSNGSYDTKDSLNPSFDFDLSIKNLEIPKAYESFATIQEMAPMAKNMTGKVNTDFHIDGKLLSNYDPDMATLSGGGLLNVFDAAMKDFKLISKLNSAANFAGLNAKADNNYPISDVLIKAEIRDGKVYFEPFDINAGGNQMNIGGSYGLDGELDYLVKSKVAANAVTGAAVSALNSFTGANLSSGPITMKFGVTGTQDDPKVKLLGVETEEGSAKNVIKDNIKDIKDKAKDDAKKKAREQADKILAEAKRNADKVRREGRNAANAIRRESNKQADDLVAKAKNPIAKKAAKEAAKKIRSEGNSKANKVENEANRRADQIMAEARKKADRVLNNP